jgi:hypothetical protein
MFKRMKKGGQIELAWQTVDVSDVQLFDLRQSFDCAPLVIIQIGSHQSPVGEVLAQRSEHRAISAADIDCPTGGRRTKMRQRQF